MNLNGVFYADLQTLFLKDNFNHLEVTSKLIILDTVGYEKYVVLCVYIDNIWFKDKRIPFSTFKILHFNYK